MKIHETNPIIIVFLIFGIIIVIGLVWYFIVKKKEIKDKTVYTSLKEKYDELKRFQKDSI